MFLLCKDSTLNLIILNQSIVKCSKCVRLVEYIKSVGVKKVRRFENASYWSKPVCGFGDINADLVIIRLAPLHTEEIEQEECLLEIVLEIGL